MREDIKLQVIRLLGLNAEELERDRERRDRLDYLLGKPWFLDLMGISIDRIRSPEMSLFRLALPLYDTPPAAFAPFYEKRVTRAKGNTVNIHDLLGLDKAQIGLFDAGFCRDLLKSNAARISEILDYGKMQKELDFLLIADAWRYFRHDNLADNPGKRQAIIDFIKGKIGTVPLKPSIFSYTDDELWGEKALTLEDLKNMPDEQVTYLQELYGSPHTHTIRRLIMASGADDPKTFSASRYDEDTLDKFARLHSLIGKNLLSFAQVAGIPDEQMDVFDRCAPYLGKGLAYADLIGLDAGKSAHAMVLLEHPLVYQSVLRNPDLAKRIIHMPWANLGRNEILESLAAGMDTGRERSRQFNRLALGAQIECLTRELYLYTSPPPSIRNPEPW